MPRPLRTTTALCLAALVGCGGGATGTTPAPDAATPDDVASDGLVRDAQDDAVNPTDDTVNPPDDVVNTPDDAGPGGAPVAARTGETVLMPANVPHAVAPRGRLKMLLVMVRGEKAA